MLNEGCDGKRTDCPNVDKNELFYAINRYSVLAGYLCGGNDNNALQRFNAAMELPQFSTKVHCSYGSASCSCNPKRLQEV